MNTNEQFNLQKIVFYHLFPGLPVLFVTLIFYFWGLPIMLSIMFAIMLGLIPTQMYIILRYAKKNNTTIKDMISFKNKLKSKELITTVIILFVISFLLYGTLSFVEHALFDMINKDYMIFSKKFLLYKFSFDTVSNEMKLTILTLNLLCNGLIAPIVEELYFRGFLLPRMKILNNRAPLVNAILFSIYHFISPYELITRIFSFFPISYAVWKKECIEISIIIHCAINTIGAIMLLLSVS